MSKTIAEAITALATKVKGSAATPADGTKVAALDALVDAMAGSDVPMPQWSTIAEAIDLITANYTPGGGGGVDVGAPTLVVRYNYAPEVDGYLPYGGAIGGVAIGDAIIVRNMPDVGISAVASGVTATTSPDSERSPTSCNVYVVTVVNEVITAVEQWDGTLTQGTFGPDERKVWTFTVPALEFDTATWSGQALFLHMTTS